MFQYDHEFFINLAQELEKGNAVGNNQSGSGANKPGQSKYVGSGQAPSMVNSNDREFEAGVRPSQEIGPSNLSFSVQSRVQYMEGVGGGGRGLRTVCKCAERV